VTRIDESAQTDPGDRARLAGGNVAVQVGDDALRQVVGFDFARHRQRLQFWHQPPVAADDPLDQALVPQVVEPALLAVALTGGVDQRQVARLGQPARARVVFEREVQRFQRAGDVLGETGADEAAGGEGVAGADQAHRLAGADDLAALGDAQRSEQRMLHDESPRDAMGSAARARTALRN